MTGGVTVFQGIGATLDNATKTFILDVASQSIDTIYPWAIASLSVYVIMYGYMMILGKIDEPFTDGIAKMAKVVFISVLALSTDTYLEWVVAFFKGIEDGLAVAFGNSNGTSSSIYSILDAGMDKALGIVVLCQQRAWAISWPTELPMAIGWYLIAFIITLCTGLVVLAGGITVLLSTVYLKILLAIGPVFIISLMFPQTTKFFDSWVGYVINHILIIALTAVVLTLAINIFEAELIKIDADSADNLLQVSLELLAISAILFAVVKEVTKMAASLAGGLSMSVVNMRGGSRGAYALGRTGQTAAKAGLGLSQGAYGLGQRAIGSASSNSVRQIDSGGSQEKWVPAYQQIVMENLRKFEKTGGNSSNDT